LQNQNLNSIWLLVAYNFCIKELTSVPFFFFLFTNCRWDWTHYSKQLQGQRMAWDPWHCRPCDPQRRRLPSTQRRTNSPPSPWQVVRKNLAKTRLLFWWNHWQRFMPDRRLCRPFTV
jgi:hypothetical protein